MVCVTPIKFAVLGVGGAGSLDRNRCVRFGCALNLVNFSGVFEITKRLSPGYFEPTKNEKAVETEKHTYEEGKKRTEKKNGIRQGAQLSKSRTPPGWGCLTNFVS